MRNYLIFRNISDNKINIIINCQHITSVQQDGEGSIINTIDSKIYKINNRSPEEILERINNVYQ